MKRIITAVHTKPCDDYPDAVQGIIEDSGIEPGYKIKLDEIDKIPEKLINREGHSSGIMLNLTPNSMFLGLEAVAFKANEENKRHFTSLSQIARSTDPNADAYCGLFSDYFGAIKVWKLADGEMAPLSDDYGTDSRGMAQLKQTMESGNFFIIDYYFVSLSKEDLDKYKSDDADANGFIYPR